MSAHQESPVEAWMGWSNGKWEGETLVVDTKGYLDTTWFDRAGNHHSEDLHTIERFSARSPDTLNYEVTIKLGSTLREDPADDRTALPPDLKDVILEARKRS